MTVDGRIQIISHTHWSSNKLYIFVRIVAQMNTQSFIHVKRAIEKRNTADRKKKVLRNFMLRPYAYNDIVI